MKKILYLIFFLYTDVVLAQTASDIKQIEDYLNNMMSLKANFVQMASNGTTSEGRLYIAKPSKIRMEYAPPASVLIVGNGDYIVFNDQELDQVTNIDYEDIPATMILANDIKIDNDTLKITDFYKDNGTTSVTLEHSKSADLGPITLVFSNSPFELKQWKIVDPQSVEVTLSLYDVSQNVKLDDGLFTFKKSPKNKRRRR
ncbi:MAG: outer membrane lipoprotein carrier protein LolA [Alphaproteobacteria bacterium]|nr:outer membrane lipoprotein carrier protein LolA [Alphaproteobacteria bacterium]